MLLRHAQLADLDQIVQIELANFGPDIATTKQAFDQRLRLIPDTFLVIEADGELAGYVEGPVVTQPYLTDDLFHKVTHNPVSGGYIAITSLSVAETFKGQGIGTTLLAAMKDLAISQGRQGIVLTCEEHLLTYYTLNGFSNEGISASKHGGKVWYRMLWTCSDISSHDNNQ